MPLWRHLVSLLKELVLVVAIVAKLICLHFHVVGLTVRGELVARTIDIVNGLVLALLLITECIIRHLLCLLHHLILYTRVAETAAGDTSLVIGVVQVFLLFHAHGEDILSDVLNLAELLRVDGVVVRL